VTGTDTVEVKTHLEAGVLAITLARPAKKNALTDAMYALLADALDAAREDAQVRVVLLCGEGADFCAGNDIADFLAAASSGQPLEHSQVLRFLRQLTAFDKPIVAAVTGRAVGVGTTLLLHCDLVYVAEDARLSAPFVDLALVPEAASSLLLPERLGHVRAFALLALGESLSGREAERCGLANAALPASEVLAKARQAALTLAAKPWQALQATKRLMRDPARVLPVVDAESRVFAQRLASEEAQTLFRGFLARRTNRDPAAS
jgi:enoyl-CoA hydratase/carnithine racemase